MDIQTFHKYLELAEKGKVRPLTCDHCGTNMAVRASKDGEPLLQCFTCGTKTRPGLKKYEIILAVVKEHNA